MSAEPHRLTVTELSLSGVSQHVVLQFTLKVVLATIIVSTYVENIISQQQKVSL